MGNPKAKAAKDYVEFNSRRQYGQNQYVSNYIEGSDEVPNLGKGLRWILDRNNYHNNKIHKDDEVRFDMRWTFYRLMKMLGKYDLAQKFADRVVEFGELKVSDPSHYDYLEACYGDVCASLGVPDHFNGHFSSHGDKMHQYRDKWVKAGIPWFHGVVCYTLAISIWFREIRDTADGWVDPSDWVITNYHEGRELHRYMVDNTLLRPRDMLQWG